MHMTPGRFVSTLVTSLLLGALAGIGYDILFELSDLAASAVIGSGVGLLVFGYERGIVWPRFRDRVRLLSTPFYLLVSPLILVVLILVGRSLGVLVVWFFGLHHMSMPAAMMVPTQGLLYGAAVSVVFVTAYRVRDVVGPGPLFNLLIGRYHRPLVEDRIFLFVDLVGSTAFAEQHGDLAAQDLLGRVFAAMAAPVARAKGSIDDYVGDLAMITWPAKRGLRDARCIACVFDIMETIEAGAHEWVRRYGEVPRFRAGLHCGSVVTAEIGVERHKIAYFGDVVNTTARLETLTRRLDMPVLASRDLLDRLAALPRDIESVPLGTHALRGRDQPLEVVGLRRTAQPGSVTAAIAGRTDASSEPMAQHSR